MNKRDPDRKPFEDELLLKLKRQFSESEYIALLNQKCSEQGIEIGMLKSEIAELEYKLAQFADYELNLEKLEQVKQELEEFKAEYTEFTTQDRTSKKMTKLLDKIKAHVINIRKLKIENSKQLQEIIRLKRLLAQKQ